MTAQRFFGLAAAALLLAGGLLMAVVLIGPRVGLGVNETFVLYQAFGLDRTESGTIAAIVLVGGFASMVARFPVLGSPLAKCALVVGIGLMVINIYGELLGAKVFPEIQISESGPGQSLGGLQARLNLEALERLPGEPPATYAERLTMTLHDGMMHHWASGATPVPIAENWVLWSRALVNPAFRDYEFRDPALALRRGYGLCSQFSMIIADLLHREGMQTQIIGIGAHVLATAEVEPGIWYLLDGDFGVVAPYSLAEVEANPSLIEPYYAAVDNGHLAAEFDPANNEVFSPEDYRPDLGHGERLSYLIKWLLPILMIVIGLGVITNGKRVSNQGRRKFSQSAASAGR